MTTAHPRADVRVRQNVRSFTHAKLEREMRQERAAGFDWVVILSFGASAIVSASIIIGIWSLF